MDGSIEEARADPPREQRRRDRLIAELHDEGVELLEDDDGRVRVDGEPYWDEANLFDPLVDELAYARRPPVHEGRRSSYGAIVLPDPDWVATKLPDADVGGLIDLAGQSAAAGDLATVRAYANGRTTFLVRSVFGPEALIELQAGDELALVRLAQDLGVYVIQRTPAGAVKAFVQDRLYVFEHDQWSVKPYAATHLFELGRLLGRGSLGVSGALLDFCLHRLSARHVGATLVWLLDGTWQVPHAGLADPGHAPAAALRLDEPHHLEALATLLAAVDGACLLEPDGTVARVEAKLGTSDTATALIAPERGTRHTSAKRFSFDEARAVVFVVSQDGPVTVYSDGISVLHLARVGTLAAGLRAGVPAKAADVANWLEEVTCSRCGKRLAVELTAVTGWMERVDVDCPVCGQAAIASRVAYSMRAAYPLKPWEDQPRAALLDGGPP